MKTKIIPFDLETAKKIQAEEIEGRIVTTVGGAARIVCFDKKTNTRHPLVVLIHDLRDPDIESVGCYTTKGEVVGDEIYNLCIELPEETPKQEFKEGERIKIIGGQYAGKYGVVMHNNYDGGCKIYISTGQQPVIDYQHLIKYGESSYKPKEETPKHEFKPFNKVLVRSHIKDFWKPAIFQYFCENGSFPYKASGEFWLYMIPYEGNEHLVGTTDKPKEE